LDAVQQQRIVSALVENKMRDLIKNKAPELLGVRGEELDRFVHDLFDLRTMDLTIPTVD